MGKTVTQNSREEESLPQAVRVTSKGGEMIGEFRYGQRPQWAGNDAHVMEAQRRFAARRFVFNPETHQLAIFPDNVPHNEPAWWWWHIHDAFWGHYMLEDSSL